MVLFLLYKIPSDAENFVLSDDTLNVSMELSKAVFEILSTLAGIVMFFNDLQPENAMYPIIVVFFPM